jgi:hypothetical protein
MNKLTNNRTFNAHLADAPRLSPKGLAKDAPSAGLPKPLTTSIRLIGRAAIIAIEVVEIVGLGIALL